MWVKQCKVISGKKSDWVEEDANIWIKDNPQFKIDKFTFYPLSKISYAKIFIEYQEYILEDK
jgi:hypothetical protein